MWMFPACNMFFHNLHFRSKLRTNHVMSQITQNYRHKSLKYWLQRKEHSKYRTTARICSFNSQYTIFIVGLEIDFKTLFFVATTLKFCNKNMAAQLVSTLPCSKRRVPSQKTRRTTPSMRFRISQPTMTCSMRNRYVVTRTLLP